jgi:hypothetical protein
MGTLLIVFGVYSVGSKANNQSIEIIKAEKAAVVETAPSMKHAAADTGPLYWARFAAPVSVNKG